MAESDLYQEALSRLREILVRVKEDGPVFEQLVGPRDQVFERFQRTFSPEHLPNLAAEESRAFLLSENNRHWGLQRQGPKMTADIASLRESLAVLLDENRPIAERIDRAVDLVEGMGKAVATAILLVVFPRALWGLEHDLRRRTKGIRPVADF